VEVLSHLLKHPTETGRISGHKVCALSPSVCYLLLVDDSLIFCKANREQASAIKEILADYESASNSKTYVVLSRGTQQRNEGEVLITMDIREVLSPKKYLGLPTHVVHSKKKAFAPIKGKIAKKVTGWMESVTEGGSPDLPTYAMSVFKFPSEFCHFDDYRY